MLEEVIDNIKDLDARKKGKKPPTEGANGRLRRH